MLINHVPVKVRSLIERKLSLLKREFEQKNNDSRQRAFSKLRAGILENLKTRRVGKVLIGVPIEVYLEIASDAVSMTKLWPMAVWEAIAHILDKAGIRNVNLIELSAIVDKFAWATDQMPFTLTYIKPEPFREAVFRIISSYAISREDMSLSFDQQLNVVAASHSVSIAHFGRQAREAVAVAMHEYLLATPIHDIDLVKPDQKVLPAERRKRLQARVKQEKAKGTKPFLQVVAKEEGISVARLKQLIKEVPEPVNKWTSMLPKTSKTSSK